MAGLAGGQFQPREGGAHRALQVRRVDEHPHALAAGQAWAPWEGQLRGVGVDEVGHAAHQRHPSIIGKLTSTTLPATSRSIGPGCERAQSVERGPGWKIEQRGPGSVEDTDAPVARQVAQVGGEGNRSRKPRPSGGSSWSAGEVTGLGPAAPVLRPVLPRVDSESSPP